MPDEGVSTNGGGQGPEAGIGRPLDTVMGTKTPDESQALCLTEDALVDFQRFVRDYGTDDLLPDAYFYLGQRPRRKHEPNQR